MKSANFNVFSEGFYDKQNIASVLNSVFIYSIIVGSCFTKIPQLTKIVSKKNAAGISFASVYVEILVATSLIVFSIKEKLAIKLFVDVILINTQNILIVLFMWKYSNSYCKRVQISKACLYVLFNLFLLLLLPDALAPLLGLASAPLSCLSKVPQIYVNYKNQSTGNLSFASYLLIFCGNLARIYIILFNVENWIYLINSGVNASLNLTILCQMLYYRNKACLTAKKDKEKQL
ncbi:conserved Plasmodium protein, unknown function [Plasmodium vivax]|uniref:PQ-loop repeat-containing protein n=1 Tax=Plasmodium vivax TaxID=5855 RepID=A0A1G4GY12_PLAVI|nr:conserved Plasmodium protein, unknown function [Plasmodium vivax]VUZ96023.1 PQ-loop repeat-containing protein [Plasmodium vivax]